jgi:hypothetical protein
MTTIISEKFAELHYDEQTPCFIIDWKGFQKLALVQPFCENVVNSLIKKRKENPNLTGFIGNSLKMEGLTEDIQNYWNQEWNPAMYEAGGRFLALIVPSSIFGKFSINKFADTTQKNIKEVQIRFFDDINNAKEWLAICQNTNQV